MQGQYSLRSPAVKRLMKEAQELREPTEQYHAQPLEDNLFEWHFTIRGPGDSDFNGGIYHGRIILPPEYPMKPPSIIILTPNGRFETNTKICLSISGHHPESWQPSWSIRTALLAIIGFMPTHGAGAMGSLDYTPEERKKLAKKSLEYKCPICGGVKDLLRPVTEASKADSEEAKELASQIDFQGEKKRSNSDTMKEGDKENTVTPPADNSSTISSSSTSVPPWAQMPNSSSAYNPFMSFMPPVANSTRPMSAGSMPQMRPYMTFSQFAAMQPLMQQQMQQMRGVIPPQMMMSPWGMPAARFPASPSTATTAAGAQMSTDAGNTCPSPSAASSSDTAGPSLSKAPTVTPATSTSTEWSQSSSSSASSGSSSSSSGDGLRQRTAPVQQSNVTPAASQAVRSAELPRQLPPPPPSGMTQVIMIVLALAILFLLLRRLSLMGILRFDQNAEL